VVDSEGIEFRLLGPLEVRDDGRVLPLGSPKQRALLALFVLHANEPVSRDRLIDELWGDAAPATVNSAFHVYLSRLRKLLGEHLARDADGYTLRIDPDRLDARRFECLAVEGREALAAGDPERAAKLLRDALALWRGTPLAGLSEPFAAAAAARLEESRLAGLEDRIEADLELGRHRQLVAELESLVAGQPYRERLRAQLMLALYRSGRQADALNAYQQARRTLGDDLGLEPSPELRELEQAILRQDPVLAPPVPAVPEQPALPAPPAGRRRRITWAAALLAAVAAAIVIPILALRSPSSPAAVVPPNSLAVIDPGSNRVVDSTPVGVTPSQLAVGAGSVWAINVEDATLSRIDPATHALQRTITLPATPTGLAFGSKAAWVANGPAGSLSRVDPALDRVVETRALSAVHGQAGVVAVGAGSVWTVFSDSTLRRIDPRTGRVQARAIVGSAPAAIAVSADAVWVANAADDTVSRVLVETTTKDKDFTPGRHPGALAVGAGALWVADSGDDAVTRIDLTSGSLATIPVGRDPVAIAFDAGGVWVANAGDGTVSRIDPDPVSPRVVATVPVGNRPSGVAVAGARVWVSVQAAT
jgi:YVTN family beta-propeller protein